jgi:hypothetical protein
VGFHVGRGIGGGSQAGRPAHGKGGKRHPKRLAKRRIGNRRIRSGPW